MSIHLQRAGPEPLFSILFGGHIVQEISEPTRIKKKNADQEDCRQRKEFQKGKELTYIAQNQKANGNQYAITYFHCLFPLFVCVPVRRSYLMYFITVAHTYT